MENIQERQLKELRKRLALLDDVIADFERLQAVRRLEAHDDKGARMRRYSHGLIFAGRTRGRSAPFQGR